MKPLTTWSVLTAPIAWTVLFVAVLSHLPAVGFDFAGADFDGLARATGTATGDWPTHPWTGWILWSLQWPLLGIDPAGYHLTALIALALLALATARLAVRLGAGAAGAALAGLLVAVGPCAWLAVAWTSASAEIWSMLFGVFALDLWIDRRGGTRPLFGGLLAAMAMVSSPSGSLLVVVLAVGQRAFLESTGAIDARTRRARRVLLALLAAGAVAQLARSLAGAEPPLDPPSVAMALQFPRRFADALWPLAEPLRGGLAVGYGLLGMVAAVLAALARGRAGDLRPALGVLWALLALGPLVLVHGTTLPHHALGAKVALALSIGVLAGPALQRALDARARAARGATLAGAALIVVVLSGLGVHRVTHARGEDGRLVDPILHLTTITADVRHQVGMLNRTPREDGAPEQVLVLQAARVVLPEELEVPEQAEIILRTPVHAALRGERGLDLLLGPGAEARWVTHLDEAQLDAFVFLDAGDDRLRVLGPVENARIYSALIAVAAGQYSRARHDFWQVIHLQGARVRFAFDPDALPIAPEELDSEAAGFAHHLADRPEASAQRVLRLFEQIYEEIRGRELIRDFDTPVRAPRVDH